MSLKVQEPSIMLPFMDILPLAAVLGLSAVAFGQGQGHAAVPYYILASIPLTLALHVFLEKDSMLVEKFFDVDGGWLTKLVVYLCFVYLLEN